MVLVSCSNDGESTRVLAFGEAGEMPTPSGHGSFSQAAHSRLSAALPSTLEGALELKFAHTVTRACDPPAVKEKARKETARWLEHYAATVIPLHEETLKFVSQLSAEQRGSEQDYLASTPEHKAATYPIAKCLAVYYVNLNVCICRPSKASKRRGESVAGARVQHC